MPKSPDLAIFMSMTTTITQPITLPLACACGVIKRNTLVNEVHRTGPSSGEAVGGGGGILSGMPRSTPIRGILHVRIGSSIILRIHMYM